MLESLTLFEQTLVWGFIIAFAMGAIVCKTNFCTMGAVSDWVNIQDTGRMRAWVFAIATAVLLVTLLDHISIIDIGLTDSGNTAKPPYGSPSFSFLRYIIGGLLFGIGMTLGSGCGNKTFVRLGGGNLKSLLVFFAMGAGAYLMIYTDYGFDWFLSRMPVIDLTSYGLRSQGIDEIVLSVMGISPSFSHTVGYIIAGALLIFVMRSPDFYKRPENVLGGLSVGLAIVFAWYVTAGQLGQTLLEEIEFLDTVPYDAGAQSFTFVKPTAQFYYWVQEGFSYSVVSFALIAGLGVLLGAFVYSLLTNSLRFEWFADTADLARHIIGGLLMGIGGVMSLGCTFGQAITGASTLAVGSFLTFAFIVLGAAMTMKFQYYKLLYEQATPVKVLITVFADFHLLPSSWRQLDDV